MLSRCTASLLLVASTSMLAHGQAGAQQPTKPPVAIPPVEVVATRLPEAPHDVAASIQVISGDELRSRGVTTLTEALALSTGIAIAQGGDAGPASAVPEFWGLREFDAFLLVVDGVPWGGAFNPAIATASLRDVERIEILRGPAPVTYGATSFVGVIHIVHKASAVNTRYAEARGGSYGSGAAAVDLPLPLGTWNSRLSADFERRGFKDDNTSYSRGHGLWRVGKVDGDRRAWLTADLNVLRQDPASPHPREGAGLSTAVPLDANYNPAGAHLDENQFALPAGSNTPNNASGFKENIDINDVYADTHIIWPAVSNVRFMAGGDALFATGEGKGATFTYTAPLSGVTQPNVTEPSTLDRDAESERRFLGAYGSAEWKPVARFTLNGGLRLNATSEKRGESQEVTHTRLSGGLGAIYGLWEQSTDHVRLFANYRNTFKPAAFDFGLAENEGVLDPETSRSYEGGVKVRAMDGRVDVEASAFQMDFENLVTATVINNQPALINSGKTRFKGVEIGTDVRLPYSLLARASYSFHDGKFVDFVQAFDGVPTQLAGKRFEMSARHLASGGLVLSPDHGITASISANYTGDRYLNKRNSALAPAFTTVDAGVGYRTARFELRVDGQNLGDRRDAVAESEFGDAQYYRMTARAIRAGILVSY